MFQQRFFTNKTSFATQSELQKSKFCNAKRAKPKKQVLHRKTSSPKPKSKFCSAKRAPKNIEKNQMTIQSCDEYFTDHIAKDRYFSNGEDLRRCALKTAQTDLESCGVGKITENSCELLRKALFEQTLFVLCRKDDYTSNERELISESIAGVGACRYAESTCPAHISVRAYALCQSYISGNRSLRISRA